MRTLVLSALIAIMPFSGMRVICIDSPVNAGSASPVAQTETGSECERLCPLHPPAATRNTSAGGSSNAENESDCALSTGDSFVSSVFAGVAVSRPGDPPQVPQAVAAIFTESPRFPPEPELAHLAPPPKPKPS